MDARLQNHREQFGKRVVITPLANKLTMVLNHIERKPEEDYEQSQLEGDQPEN